MKEPLLPQARLAAARERMTPNYSPSDLAHVVYAELERRGLPSPDPATLTVLFETMYFTSLRTEEGSALACHVIWLDSRDGRHPFRESSFDGAADPGSSRPERLLAGDPWTFVPLAQPVPLTVRSLAKLSRASDPRTSSFVVHGSAHGAMHVSGFVDQGNQYYEFANDHGGRPPERPGVFQASIEGAGHLVVHLGYEIIAELRMNELATAPLDVLTSGPIFEKLRPSIVRHIVEVLACVGPEALEAAGDWPAVLANTWVASLCRLLLRCQNYRHGGALLIAPDRATPHLNRKYRVDYDRLPRSLVRRGAHEILRTLAHRTIRADYLSAEPGHAPRAIPAELYLDATLNETSLQEASNSIDGAIWFISLLSRVDGLVLLDPGLRVRAFGSEITVSEDPAEVWLATDAAGSSEKLMPLDDGQFGMRHRSMIRYCAVSPASIGFVISQDGEVRAITRVDDRVLVWDNIALRLDEFRTAPEA